MGRRFRVSSERLEKPGIEPTTPGLEGEQLIRHGGFYDIGIICIFCAFFTSCKDRPCFKPMINQGRSI